MVLDGTLEQFPRLRGDCIYVIEGTTLDGRRLTAVVQPFQIRQLVVIVTAYET